MALDAVVGTPSIVGFSDAGRYGNGDGCGGVKWMMNAIDRGEQTRDLMHGQRFEAEHLRDSSHDNHVAIEKVGMTGQITTEKIGAATALAVEKIGAASILAVEKIGSANQLQASQNFAALQLQASQNAAALAKDMAECCCEIKELIRAEGAATREQARSIEAARHAVELVDAKNEILALKLAAGNGNGNNSRA